MLFNSLTYLLFLPIVFGLYWFVFKKHLKAQNVLLLMASYVFYGWWDWRFLGLIALSTLIDYSLGLAIPKASTKLKAKLLLSLSLIANLGILGYFKYYNFFVESWIDAWASLGLQMQASTLQIILPVGISFYTFQTLSYTIDIYRKELAPTKSLLKFAAYVSFFPQLVAGPIERASRLLPQFERLRNFSFEFAKSGAYLIIWGLFKKVVIADNAAFFVNEIFNNSTEYSSSELILGAVLFAFQIYGDFSGYSDIAIGTARLFGFQLMTNFAFPYFSRDIAEFWRRWHISLSTWFRDYLYIPLGGSRGGTAMKVRNTFVIFLVSGFWHGANWTFIVWGFLHALFFLPLLLTQRNRNNLEAGQLKLTNYFSIIVCFILVCIAWIFFRADNLSHAYQYLYHLFSFENFALNLFTKSSKYLLYTLIVMIGVLLMLIFEFKAFTNKLLEVKLNKWTALMFVILIILMGAYKNPNDFIYFQF